MENGKVVNMWAEMENAKNDLEDIIDIKIQDKDFKFEVRFVDIDVIQEINEEYQERLPKKPNILVSLGDRDVNIAVPTDEEKYKTFNTRPDAKKKIKEWRKKCKPIERERVFRLIYEFIKDEYKPAETVEEGIKILDKSMRYSDAVKTLNQCMELLGFTDNSEKQD